MSFSIFTNQPSEQSAVERVGEFAFRIVETSVGNFQALLYVLGADENIEQRMKKFAGADTEANGATRIVGSMNVKEQHRRADGSFPLTKFRADRSSIASRYISSCLIIQAKAKSELLLWADNRQHQTQTLIPDVMFFLILHMPMSRVEKTGVDRCRRRSTFIL